MMEGLKMHEWATDLWPICRSLSGDGVRETLMYLAQRLPELQIHEVPSETKAFDWEIPNEWNIQDAYISTPDGQKICDFRQNNLHVVGYSEPVNKFMSFAQLKDHIYTLPEQPDWIPYVTSYYARRWGFCMSHKEFLNLHDGEYQVVIDSMLAPGHLTYADLVIRGHNEQEILLSTNICHPSMANNELSGPVLVTALAQWLYERQSDLKYSYRLLFIPETIGAIVYLSKNLLEMKEKIIAGFQVTCVGDERTYSYIRSRNGRTLSDRIAQEVLAEHFPEFKQYTFLDRGSDERQFCSPGIDLPIASICRSKYGEYPEYHTSADDLTLVTPSGLQGSFNIYTCCIDRIEAAQFPLIKCLGEPQLGKRGLYPTLSKSGSADSTREMMDFIAYADGLNRIEDIAQIIGVDSEICYEISEKLIEAKLIEIN